jgi:hypothetical protein
VPFAARRDVNHQHLLIVGMPFAELLLEFLRIGCASPANDVRHGLIRQIGVRSGANRPPGVSVAASTRAGDSSISGFGFTLELLSRMLPPCASLVVVPIELSWFSR